MIEEDGLISEIEDEENEKIKEEIKINPHCRKYSTIKS